MSTELTRFREYARERAEWQPGDARETCRERTTFGTKKPADHANCGGFRCGCDCHRPSDRDRALFKQLADEIDDHLTPQPDLFGGMSNEPEETADA